MGQPLMGFCHVAKACGKLGPHFLRWMVWSESEATTFGITERVRFSSSANGMGGLHYLANGALLPEGTFLEVFRSGVLSLYGWTKSISHHLRTTWHDDSRKYQQSVVLNGFEVVQDFDHASKGFGPSKMRVFLFATL